VGSALTTWAAVGGVAVLYSNLGVVFAGSPLAGLVWMFGWILLAVPLCHRVLIRRQVPEVDGVCLLLVLFLMAQLASAILAVDLPLALRAIAEYVTEGMLVYWLVVNAAQSRSDLHHVMGAAVATCALLAAMTVYQAASGDYGQQFGGLAQRELPESTGAATAGTATAARGAVSQLSLADRAAGPIGEPNRYAQILLVVLPWTLYFTRHAATPLARLSSAAAAWLLLAAVVLTYSRGAFLALGLLVVCLLAWRVVRPARLAAVTLLLAVVAVLAAPSYVARVASIGSAGDLGDPSAPVEPDGAIRGRATEMLAALAVFLDYPVLGVGPAQYVPFYSERYQRLEDISFRFLPRPRESHNLYASVAAETGAVGLLILMTIVISLLVALRRARRWWAARSLRRADLASMCAMSLVAYLATGVFLHLSYERYFWCLVGIVSAAASTLRREQRERAARPAALRLERDWPAMAR
jgi:O-antigen ligase